MTGVRTARHLIAQEPADQTRFLNGLTERELICWEHDWTRWGRPDQMPPDPPWSTWLIMAGRGFGKTRAGAEWVRAIAEQDGSARFALVGANYAECRSVMIEGESGLLTISAPDQRPEWEPSLKRLRWPGGAEAQIYSAAEPEALRGPQSSHSWCDEIAKWINNAGQAEATWHNLKMGLRLGENPQVVLTTTPRPVPLVRTLVKDPDVVITRGRTYANALNLPQAFLTAMERDYAGTRLGRQELDGELIEDIAGALWSRQMIESSRVQNRLLLDRIVIGVDPPASAHGDACGIIVAGVTGSGSAIRGFVLADCSVEQASPETWARAVASSAEHWNADRIIAEANQGGAMVKSVLQAARISLPVRLVHAARGKVARAEPVAALYENGRVHHAGCFPRLEDEMCGLLTGGAYEGPGRSPDRADALVWALTELMLARARTPNIRPMI
ncbi:Large terminase phage packaging protein [Parasphingorhabdus marina DSM 22363]|uniref:Large terminase phage packaging protein n=1 Tax=Parasphingorhabdus marina DSM 22363 TaxID=1123272 RepID=A0A1N6CMF1_9SPHN|nr:terminase family protein [Parasphingorhabdus marina]SIN59635.1 Large terminase phage packaging protein [Parasphingorhabdus marina DSM 22363]